MKIECVVVCVECEDFLAHTLPQNKNLFDRMVVVTASKDLATKRLCEFHHVECYVTDAFFKHGDKFNKGRAINEALEYLDFKEWCMLMDADIILPPRTRSILHDIPLNEQFLYGVDRLMCPNYEEWTRFALHPLPQHELAYVHVGPYPVGTRLMKLEQGGWVPLGFLQMFHRQAHWLGKPFFPTEWDSAATSDLHFAYKAPRTHRHLLPEILAFHLATQDQTDGKMGGNWMGRRTSRFGPKDPYDTGYRKEPAFDPNEKMKR